MTLKEELAKVAAGVQNQIADQMNPEMRSLVIVAAPTGEMSIAHNLEPERLIKVLKRALDNAQNGKRDGGGILWLPPGVRA